MDNQPTVEKEKKSIVKWLKRLGLAGFLFFLIKGLIWLVVLYYGVSFFGCEG